ncbi:MAG: VOC family protein [Acidimicrobiales bacterium]
MSTTDGPDDGIHLDHVAVASTHAWDQLIRYGYELGGEWLGGPPIDDERAFYFCQVGFAGGTKIELLEPLPGPGSDFLRRFLDRNGPGPHHLTFKVPDFDAALDAASAAGYPPVGISRSDDWCEAFLHPRQSHGIVIQLAHHRDDHDGWALEGELPPALRTEPPLLVSVDHLVADVDAAVALFTGPLAMNAVEEHHGPDGDHVVLSSGAWRLRLVRPRRADWQHWLGDRSGRLHQLVLALDEPGSVRRATPVGDGLYVVAPEHNLGTRLLLGPRLGSGGSS